MPETIQAKKALKIDPHVGEANKHSLENASSPASSDSQISTVTSWPQADRISSIFSAQDSAWLQRVVGNRATSRLLGLDGQIATRDKVGSSNEPAPRNSTSSSDQKNSKPAVSNRTHKISSAINTAQHIQRDVGFEFEVDNTVAPYRKNMLGNYRPLTKRERILTGVDFYIEADGMPGGGSSWEFVTTNFPETMGGLTRLITALNQIDGIIDLMRNSPLQPTVNGVTGPFANFGTVVNNRYFTISNAVFTVKPQVTAGFALEALDEIFNSASNNPGVGVSNLARDTAGMDNFGQAPNPPAPDIPLGQMRTAADNAITVAIPGGPANPALRGLVTQLVQILVAGHQPIGATPKTVMRVALARSDLKAVFDTLPPHLHMYFQGNPAAFVTMVMAAANAVSPAALNPAQPAMSGALFTHHQYVGDKRHNMPSPFMQVTRTQWLTSLAAPGGQDLLSKDRYPVRTNTLGKRNKTDKKANKLLNSMGALHNQLDPGNRPIFEIRSSGSLHAGLIQPYALDFFKYVRYLHNPLALTESDELTGMDRVATNDVADLVGFSPNRALVLLNIQANAVTDFNT